MTNYQLNISIIHDVEQSGIATDHDLFDWSKASISHHIPGASTLEQRLLWPNGTLAILNHAFTKNLSRWTVWDLRGIEEQYTGAYQQAARIFRRGVTTLPSSNVLPRAVQYPIKVVTHEELVADLRQTHAFVVMDASCARYHPLPHSFVIESNEEKKSLATIGALVDAWHRQRCPDRWYAIGGGLVGDLVGFAAGIAGCNVVQIPTTLLAMIDSSIGGKTGVNYMPWGKNQVGLFHHPTQVSIWPGFLKSCNPAMLRSGVAEAVKHALLSGDRELLAYWLSDRNKTIDAELLLKTLAVKAQVVERDPTETGERAILNLGHTFAHALEGMFLERGVPGLAHGECVALGLVFDAILSAQQGYATMQIANELLRGFGRQDFVITLQELGAKSIDLTESATREALMRYMQHDKKGSFAFVLLDDVGNVYKTGKSYTTTVNADAVSDVLNTWKNLA